MTRAALLLLVVLVGCDNGAEMGNSCRIFCRYLHAYKGGDYVGLGKVDTEAATCTCEYPIK